LIKPEDQRMERDEDKTEKENKGNTRENPRSCTLVQERNLIHTTNFLTLFKSFTDCLEHWDLTRIYFISSIRKNLTF
jgi:hypothetical protein